MTIGECEICGDPVQSESDDLCQIHRVEEEVHDDFERYLSEWESFDEVRSGRVPWLWAGRITYGALTSLAGRPKVGKGTFYSWLTAQVTTGTLDGDSYGRPRSVLIVTSEDAATFTLKPRLVAAGADMTRVYHPRGDVTRSDSHRTWRSSAHGSLAAISA